LLDVAKQHIPNKTITVRLGDKPWYNPDLRCLKRKMDRAHHKAKIMNTENTWAKYKELRNEYCHKIKNAKFTYAESLSDTVETAGGLSNKQFWHFTKSILGKSADCCLPPLKQGNTDEVCTDTKAKAELLNQFFASKCNLDDSASNLPTHVRYKTDSRLSMIDITVQEVEDVLKSLNTNKATGPDCISPFMLKNGSKELAPSLTRLFNYSLKICKIPQAWKAANVIPIYKKGDKQDVANYRPVSLLSVVNKCFEKIIFKYCYNFFTEHKLFTKWQSGFTPGDSTVKQLINIYHTFAQALDNKKDVRIVFCDISSAFDRVWHRGLLHKLQSVGIAGNLLNWFETYLTDRTQKVVLPGQESSEAHINAGVPQGSVLGPLLFLIFINDLPECVNSEIRLFADDSTLFVIVEKIEHSADILNTDLAKIDLWAKRWLVKFNPAKTESLYISNKPNRPLPPLHFAGEQVRDVTDHKHLGVVISRDLSWNKHIDDVCLRASKRLDLLRVLKYKLSRRALELIYYSSIRPIIEYGDILYNGCGVVNESKLNKVQYEASKIVTGAMHGTGSFILLKELGWETLNSRRERHMLCMFYGLMNGQFPEHLSDILPQLSVHNYSMRNSLIPSIPCRTSRFYNSYFPSCVRLWNDLDDVAKNSPTTNSFQAYLMTQTPRKHPQYYYLGQRPLNILLTRLRLNCSTLNSYLYKIGVSDSPKCRCGNSVETTAHYFLHCPLYATQRRKLHDCLLRFATFNIETILHGLESSRHGENKVLCEVVCNYIHDTKRFV
jgi:hypothetical protein